MHQEQKCRMSNLSLFSNLLISTQGYSVLTLSKALKEPSKYPTCSHERDDGSRGNFIELLDQI
jgi:hypothetical protein